MQPKYEYAAPGPWFVVENQDDAKVLNIDDSDDGDDYPIACVLRGDAEERAANAALIADAPTLLAERDELRDLLADATNKIEAWSAYVSEYFREKHDMAGTIVRYRNAIARIR